MDRAVRAAREAFEDGRWSGIAAAKRTRAMLALADAIEAHADELAELESLDNGKPVKLARRVDVALAAEHIRYFAGWPTKIEGGVLPVAQPNMHCYTRKEPVGVCGQIIPWNFPLLMAAWKIGPALAAGCTIVLKPAEQTPLTALRLGELALEAGLPEGVLNVITGDGETGAALVDHPGVDKIAFTGSTAVGREIGAKAGRALKRVTLELGGKSPNIILPDADLDVAVKGAYQAIYYNTGQACNAGSRLFVHSSQYDDVVSGLAEAAGSARLGPGLEPGSQMGPRDLGGAGAARARLHREGHERGRRARHRRHGARRRRLLHRADAVQRHQRRPRDRARGDLRPGAGGAARTTRSRRSRAARTTPTTAWRPGCGRATWPRPTSWRRCCAQATSGSTRGARATRRRRSAGSRPQASAASTAASRPGRLPREQDRLGQPRLRPRTTR